MVKKLIIKTESVKVILAVLFSYIVLFEFVIPPVYYFPKPSLLYESFLSLVGEYGFISALIADFAVITLTIALSVILVYLFNGIMINLFSRLGNFADIFGMVNYVFAFIVLIIFTFIFHDSLIAEFVYIFLVVMGLMKQEIYCIVQNFDPEMVFNARSLGYSDADIRKRIIWKKIQPEVFTSLSNKLGFFWLLLLIYAFIGHTNGLGELFNKLMTYNDYTGIITLSVLTSLIIWCYDLILKYFVNKIFFWGKNA